MRRSRHGLSLMSSALVLATVLAIAYDAGGTVATAGAKAPAKKPARKHHTSTANALTGTFSGRYGGAFSGTFVLRWTQTGSALSGTITISNPSSTLTVHGTLHGSAITFGTVGGAAITYTGTVSGTSMSGSYSTPKGGGPWSAAKT